MQAACLLHGVTHQKADCRSSLILWLMVLACRQGVPLRPVQGGHRGEHAGWAGRQGVPGLGVGSWSP